MSSKIGFHGPAPTAQRANANQAAATDLASVIILANELRAVGREGAHHGRSLITIVS